MNAPTDPRELASAIVDGLLPDEEASRAMAQPAVAAHVDEMLQVRDRLRTVPQPDELSKARALNAALEAGMETHRQSFQPAATSRLPTLAPRRRMPAWLAVAAVVAVLALAAGLITSLGRDQSDSVASSDAEADTSASEESLDSAGGSGGSADRGAAGSATDEVDEGRDPDAGTTDLGPADDVEELGAMALDDYLAPGAVSEPAEPQVESENDSTADGAESERCAAMTQAGDPARGTSVNIATAELNSEMVWVHLYERPGDELLMVATNEDCVDVAEELVRP